MDYSYHNQVGATLIYNNLWNFSNNPICYWKVLIIALKSKLPFPMVYGIQRVRLNLQKLSSWLNMHINAKLVLMSYTVIFYVFSSWVNNPCLFWVTLYLKMGRLNLFSNQEKDENLKKVSSLIHANNKTNRHLALRVHYY